MHDGPPSDLPAAAASAAPVHLWRFSRTQRLVTAAAAVVMIPLAFAPVLMLVAVAIALNDNPIEWIVVAVLALLGAVGLILPLVALLVIRAAPIAARWRVELTGRELQLVVPPVWVGLNPFAPLRRVTVPISGVRAVEIREEVSRFAGIVSIARVLSVATTKGERFVLGQATGQEVSALPIDEMAQAIADAAGQPVTDRGTVDAPSFLQTTLFGRTAPWDGPDAAPAFPPAEAARVRSRAALIWQILILATGLLAVVRACTHD